MQDNWALSSSVHVQQQAALLAYHFVCWGGSLIYCLQPFVPGQSWQRTMLISGLGHCRILGQLGAAVGPACAARPELRLHHRAAGQGVHHGAVAVAAGHWHIRPPRDDL